MSERKRPPLTFTQKEIVSLALEFKKVTGISIPQKVLAEETGLTWLAVHVQVNKIFDKGFSPPIVRSEHKVAQGERNKEIAEEVKIAKRNPHYLNNFIGNLPYGFYRPYFDLLGDAELDRKSEKWDGRNLREFLTDIDFVIQHSKIPIDKIKELQEQLANAETGSREKKDARRQLTLLGLPIYAHLRKKGYSQEALIR